MKVLLFNGSPHKEGCTYTALQEISKTLKEEGIESEIYQIGTKLKKELYFRNSLSSFLHLSLNSPSMRLL